MSDPLTISFIGTKELKNALQQWAEKEDRSVSYIIRQILEKEIYRRTVEAESNGKETSKERNYLPSEI
jgi:predicted transcriptional regulator